MIISLSIFYFSFIYIILFVAYAGWGKIFSSYLNIKGHKGREDYFTNVWLGWALSLVLFHTIHLFHPLSPAVSGMFFLAGICLALKNGFRIREIFTAVLSKKIYFAILTIASFWVASHAMSSPKIYDSGLYHFNSIRWLQEYAIVPGLGNLHGRLAFNITFFGYVASLNAFPPFSYGHNFGNSFLLMLVFAECLYPILNRPTQYSRTSQVEIFIKATLIPLILVFSIDKFLSSPTADIASAFLRIVLFYNFVIILDQIRRKQRPSGRIKFLLVLSATALTIKLSNAMYASVLILICCFFCCFLRHKYPLKNYLKTLSFVVFCLVLWMGRGVITSGCPLYPSNTFCVNLDWTVSTKAMGNQVQDIKGYRKAAGNKNINGLGWIKPWFAKQSRKKGAFVYPASLALIASFTGLLFLICSLWQKSHKDKLILLLPMIPLWASLAFWFIMSPGLRFANPFFYLLAIAGFLPLFDLKHGSRGIPLFLPGSIILAISLPILFSFAQYRPTIKLNAFSGAEPVRSAQLETFRTNTGLEVYTPVEGDQCWDSPLPASPYQNSKLSLRKGTIASGFIIQ